MHVQAPTYASFSFANPICVVCTGANFMLVNGLSVDIASFDFFSFLDRLKSELRLMGLLKQLGLEQEDVQGLLQVGVAVFSAWTIAAVKALHPTFGSARMQSGGSNFSPSTAVRDVMLGVRFVCSAVCWVEGAKGGVRSGVRSDVRSAKM